MVAQYHQLHMTTNDPTKFEQNKLSGFWGVAFTKSSVTDREMDTGISMYPSK